MRKILAIFLFLCFAAPFLGTYAWLRYERCMVRKTVKKHILQGMDEKTLRVFKFTREAVASQLRWEHAEEFEYQGQLYDVVERQQVGDTTVFKCWWDRKETQVKAQLEDLIAKTLKQHPPNQESQKRLQQFLTFLFFEAPTFQWYAQPCPVGTEAPGWCQRRYVPFNTSPPTPPPKIG